MQIFTIRNSKVVFSQARVKNSVRDGGMPGRRACMGVCVVGACMAGGDMWGRGGGHAADNTRPAGIHSCL